MNMKKILITGANGFIGNNLRIRFCETPNIKVITFNRGDRIENLQQLVVESDAIIHLAGENRPTDTAAFDQVNVGLTKSLCEAIRKAVGSGSRTIPLVFASSTQAELDNPYGRSKLAGEKAVESLAEDTGNPAVVFRLPGVFGKWCKPDYNSVVATFCYRIARGLPIQITDPAKSLQLVYIDDVVSAIVDATGAESGLSHGVVAPVYNVTLGELAQQINAFRDCRSSLVSERVALGFVRGLYATFLSYLPIDDFAYDVPQHADSRGVFVEMLKTHDSGQISYFTAHPGITRGCHYHHTKSEKFLVVKGQALFRFKHLMTGNLVEIAVNADTPRIVDTIPGWVHEITNVGDSEMIVLLWANEVFDRNNPDTFVVKM